MPRYNSQFELTIADIDLIETALRDRQRELAARRSRVAVEGANLDGIGLSSIDLELEHTAELLGRLHNQKVFFRPTSGAYVSG